MKKFFLFIFTVILSAGLFTALPVLAAEKDKIKIYYSEPIGAGEKVYHMTACQKIKKYAPLRCSEENRTISSQCWKADGSTKVGEIIKGCIVRDAAGKEKSIPGTSYPEVDLSKYRQAKPGGCSDVPEEQSAYYVPVWAVVDRNNSQDSAKWTIFGTIPWEGEPPEEVKNKLSPTGIVIPSYEPGLCVVWDVFSESEEKAGDEELQNYEASAEGTGLLQKVGYGKSLGHSLIVNGCNNNEHSSNVDPEPSATCSLQERISGDSGVDIFANYVGAIYKWASGVVGIVAVLTIVYSGILISMAGGDSAKLDEAKNRIMQSLIGLAILFLSGLILYTINPGFFTGG